MGEQGGVMGKEQQRALSLRLTVEQRPDEGSSNHLVAQREAGLRRHAFGLDCSEVGQ